MKRPRVVVLGIAILAGAVLQAVPAGQPSRTAIMAAVFRAVGARNPDAAFRNPDYLAEKLITPADLDYLAKSGADYRPQMQWKGDELVSHLKSSVAFTTNYVRTVHIDHSMEQAIDGGAMQVVILGAGLDSRAYRFSNKFPQVKFYELDHPATQELKVNRVREALGNIPSAVRYVPIDFTKDSLLAQLSRGGYSETERSFFVWEGVVHYIPEAAVRDTLRFVATHSSPGSQIIFDYPFATNRRINNSDDLFARWGEPFLFGFPAGGPGAMVREVGLRLVSDFSNSELVRRYAVRPDGSSSLRIATPGTNADLDDAAFAVAERPVTARGQ